MPFYVAVSRGEGSTDERLDAAADEVLDAPTTTSCAQWQSWLTANA